MGVSSATVRNILADLETEGYLGIPTPPRPGPDGRRYRFYVESLVGSPLPQIEQLMIRHQFGQVEFASDQWFRLAATTLASSTHSAGLATPAKPRAVRIRRLELLGIGERMASLIVVLNEGSLKQALLAIDPGTSEDELAEAAQRLTGAASPQPRPTSPSASAVRDAPATIRLPTLAGAPARGPWASSAVRRRDVEQLFSDGLST